MKRLVWLVLVLVAAFVAVQRLPNIRAKVPWLPTVPGLTVSAPTNEATTKSGDNADASSQGGRGGGRRRGGGDGPTPVLVGAVETADVPVTADVLGTIQATNTVTVRSQVDGKLISLEFQDGQDVTKGDVLARIDPAPFQAAYDQAVAKKAQDQAQLANAQTDLVRYTKLAATQYGSVQQADTQKSQVAQYQAQLQGDQAAIDTAKTTLDFATIRAPISGRTGIRLIDAGNVVHASDTTGIVTIAEVKPISAIFNLPQQLLRSVNAAQAKGALKLEAFDADTHKVVDTGALQVVDNIVDQTTGTVKMRGTFPNESLQLWPGQFVNLRLTIDVEKNVVVVPTPAIQRGPNGTFVYIAKADSTVHLQKVTVGRQTEDRSVVTEGLTPPANVVTTGFTRLTDGAKISVSQASAESNDQSAPSTKDLAKASGSEASAPGNGETDPSANNQRQINRHHRQNAETATGQTSEKADSSKSATQN